MSTTRIFRAGLIASTTLVTLAGMTFTANAQSRYGNVYDYESGQNCGQACVPAAPVTPQANTRYGAPAVAAPAYNQAPVYVDCAQMGTCAPAPAVVYTQPAPVYQQPTYQQPAQSYETYAQAAPVNCPAGTTAQSDGTCMQGSTGYSDSYTTSGSSYSTGSSFGGTVDCPAGTTAQSDGTCMQGSSYSSSSTSTYDSGSSYGYSAPVMNAEPVNCPAGTTAQSDGTCMQGGSNAYSNKAVEIYTGDASSQSSTDYGYTNDGAYGPTDYLPIRK